MDRRVRTQNANVRRGLDRLEVGGASVEDGLLEEDDAVMLGEPRQEVLRTLEDKVPPQVGENEQIHLVRSFSSGGGAR
jgi:hypothetical protein